MKIIYDVLCMFAILLLTVWSGLFVMKLNGSLVVLIFVITVGSVTFMHVLFALQRGRYYEEKCEKLEKILGEATLQNYEDIKELSEELYGKIKNL